MLATALSVPVCLLSVALQTNQAKADQTVNTSQSVQTERNNISDSNKELNQSKNNSSKNNSKLSDSSSNNQDPTKSGNIDSKSTDNLSYISVSVSADPKSASDKPLDFDNKAYILKFQIKNTSTDEKVIPKGTKFRINVQPDSRVPYSKFLNFASINQNRNDFSLVDNNDGTYDICVNNDLLAGEYNFIVNFVTANPGYDWDKPDGTNTEDPDVVPGKVFVTFQNAGKSKTIFTDNVYIKPYGYHSGNNSGIPGYGDTGNGGNAKLNDENEYPNETLPVKFPNDLVFRNPNDKSRSGSLFFSYLVNYQASIGGQAGAKLGIKSKDKFDLNHYHLFMNKDGEFVDITNDPLLKWTITDNEIEVDAGDYLIKNNLWDPLFLRAYVPEDTINAVNNVSYVTGWYKNFKNTSLFQNIDGDMNTPFFRGVNTTIYDTQDYDAKKDVYAFEGVNVLTDRIIITEYNDYPKDGKQPKADEYLIKYSVTDDVGKSVKFNRKIIVKHNQSEIKTKNTNLVAGPNSQWKMADNIDTIVGKDGEKLNLSDIKVSGTVDPTKPGDYTLTYTYTDSTGFVAKSEAVVHVVASQASLKVHDTTIYQGNTWNPASSFDSGKDEDGNDIKFDQVSVTGTVDTKTPGIYPVKYSYTDAAGNTVEANANVTVVKRPANNGVGSGQVSNDRLAQITVHYQDEVGDKLAPDRILTGYVGNGYITETLNIPGYTLKSRPDNATGFYSDQNQNVTYIYTKNATGLSPVTRTVFHNSYVYDENGIRKTGEYFAGETVKTYGTKLIKGKKYYDLGNNDFVKTVNITGVNRKLKHNAYIYTKKANKKVKRLGRKVLKKHTKLKTYGGALKMHKKLYYIVGKNRYIKKANF